MGTVRLARNVSEMKINVLSADVNVIRTDRGTMSWAALAAVAIQDDAVRGRECREALAAAWKMYRPPLVLTKVITDGSYWTELRVGGVRVAESPKYHSQEAYMAELPRDMAAMHARAAALGLD